MEKFENQIAQNTLEIIQKISFGENRTVRPVTEQGVVNDLKKAGLGLDYRAITEEKTGYKTVFEGLAFDKNAIRTQCFAVYENEQPVAIMSIAITPKCWVDKQRYIKLNSEDGVVTLLDYKGVANIEDSPDFIIAPAWSKVVDSHKTKLAMPGFKAIKNIFEMLEQEAPQNTHIEAIAQGRLENKEKEEAKKLINNCSVGANIDIAELPFPIDIIGQNADGSASTVKMAKLFGLKKIENTGNSSTLGPVFIKKLK